MGDLTAHFSKHEFACSCCGRVEPLKMALVGALERVRTTVAAPIYVSSGYRCAKHNAAVGGSPTSRHMQGEAADIHSPAGLEALWRAADEEFWQGGLGLYPDNNFIHVDIRPGRARWSYWAGQYRAIDDGIRRMRGQL
jgi:uncharacterized protein YcbK (DUF882 family)